MEHFARLKANREGSGGRRVAVCLFVLAASAVTLGQDDDPGRGFFSVSSNRTYAPGERPAIQLWAHNVKELEFRVYRVQDPFAFFQSLPDAHRFGGQAPPRPPETTTPLERFHQFKRAWRNRARDLIRAQFSAESRAEIRDMLAAREAAKARRIARKDSYATVPLLNPQRLVTVWRQPVGTSQRWDAQTVPVEVRDKGLYLVEATNGRLRAFTIVLVTDLAILTKSGPGRVFAQLVNRRTGMPVPRSDVQVLADRKEVARTASRADGAVDVPVAGTRIESVLVLARSGDDFAVNGLYGYNIGESSDNWIGYLYTDRPVYRPGHKVSFRGILRRKLGTGYALPALREVDVLIEDPDSKPVLQRRLSVSSVGTLHGELDLPVSAALGYYSLSVRSGQSQAYGGFHVEEYKKPEYEVKVLPDKRRVLQGEPVEAAIEARYYFGEPVANAKVTYAVHRSRYWSPLFYEYEPDEEEGEGAGDYADEQVVEGVGQLDASGRLRIRLPNEPRDSDVRYRIEARVTDQANREITGSGYVVATVGTFLVRAEPAQYVYEPGAQAAVIVEARDYDGNPADQPFELEVAEWRWNRPEGPRIFSAQGRTGPEGKTKVPVTLGGAGSYIVRVKARTPENRVVSDTSHIWIAGAAGGWYSARERIQIVPDRKSYKPGETAKVLIVTGVPEASVIVSAEGADLHTLQVVQAKGPTVTVDVPVRREYAPNFFVTAAFLRDNQLYQGTKSLRVPPLEQQLDVRLTSSKTEYKPGETSAFRIEARDHLDKPVRAEFSLGVVDEAIYAIRREIGQDILNFFYGRTWNRIYTSSSLSYYFEGEAGTRVMQLAKVRRRQNLAQLKPERLVDPAVRKAFPDTAFWIPDLATDASGRAEARFSFPDALTTWRATARGVTADTHIGAAVHRVTVRKNLILRLAPPRFFREGDEVTIPAIVQNYLASAKTVRVSLDVQGADVIEGATRDLEVASRAVARADYRLRIRPGARVVLLGKALTDEESDALELTIPVQPYGVKYTESRSGSLSGSGQATAELAFPDKATPGSRAVEIRVSPSLAGAIFSALEYLTSYPYGCT
jgi:hypothetical protein